MVFESTQNPGEMKQQNKSSPGTAKLKPMEPCNFSLAQVMIGY